MYSVIINSIILLLKVGLRIHVANYFENQISKTTFVCRLGNVMFRGTPCMIISLEINMTFQVGRKVLNR